MKRILFPGRGLILGGAALALAAVSGWTLARKWEWQSKDRTVEICVLYEETLQLLERERPIQPISLDTFLERCKIIGASSLASREVSLADLARNGRALYFSPAESEKLRALGAASADFIRPNRLWIPRNPVLKDSLLRVIPKGNATARRIGDYDFLEASAGDWSAESDKPLMLDPVPVQELASLGLRWAARIEESSRLGPNETSLVPGRILGTAPLIPSRFPGLDWPQSVPPTLVLAGIPEDLSARQEELARAILAQPVRVIFFENQSKVYERVRRFAGGLVPVLLRGHTIPQEEMRALSPKAQSLRWTRAVQERSCRFLFFRWNPDWNAEENLEALRLTATRLKKLGYRLGSAEPLGSGASRFPFLEIPWRPLRLGAALFVALAAPLAAMGFIRAKFLQNDRVLSAKVSLPGWVALECWGAACGIALAGGLLVQTLLPDAIFVLGLDVFRGVKAALALPWLGAGILLFGWEETRRFLERPVHYGSLIGWALAAGVLVLALTRSGNTATPPSGTEVRLREILESALRVRPRFKEFAIGHPLAIAGIYFWVRRDPASSLVPRAFWKACVWAGWVGNVSIVNSFCHLHTPLAVTALRTLHGLWLGAFGGAVLVAAVRFSSRFHERFSPEDLTLRS